MLGWALTQMASPYQIGETISISLLPKALPGYTAHTILRMLLAFMAAVIVTLIVAPLTAKNKHAEKFLLPMIDILQSIPILGVLSITIVFFIKLFPNRLLGPECAAIFAIFTSQVWNMILSLYQSLKTIPKTFYEVADIFHLSAWQRFWRIEIPYAMPGLLWNSMISASAGWFFLVAAEAISVNNQQILLPGIGSYISVAIHHRNLRAICYATLVMFGVILVYDQLFFRPLLSWANRFSAEALENHSPTYSWVYRLLAKTRWLKKINFLLGYLSEHFVNPQFLKTQRPIRILQKYHFNHSISSFFWNGVFIALAIVAIFKIWRFTNINMSFWELKRVFYLGAVTASKVAVLVIFASLLWVPVGVWIGLRPRITQIIQPIIQFLAAFPVNLIYPIAVTLILHFQLNVEIWTAPLMILGTQWYILFNVIAGTQEIPKDLQLAAKSLGLKGWLWWKKLVLPAVFPYYITGSMTTAAGCWNASIVSEVLEWGPDKLVATGLGSYIEHYTSSGDFTRVILGVVVMCVYVLLINHFVWGKLYAVSSTRFFME